MPRLATGSLAERLRVMPAVVVTGARQTGKSTLVDQEEFGSRTYRSLDDLDVLKLAQTDPTALVTGPSPVTVDEVQRAPGLLQAVKAAIDGHREPGQFLLTGSANLLLMRQVSESLAGRASYMTLWPLTRREQLGLGTAGVWTELLSTPHSGWKQLLASRTVPREDWRELALRGGFPTPALHLPASRERSIWFDGYVQTYLQRDLQDLASIAALPDVRRLMRATALRLGQLVNQTELGRELGIPQPTVHRYLNLLETSYVLTRLPPYSNNRNKRLVKTPKLYWSDTGLALHVAGQAEATGGHLENIVLNDLLVWRDAQVLRVELFHWRTSLGEEVDLVIETPEALLPIEIKATRRPRLANAAHLRTFVREYGDLAGAGLLLHDGDELEWLTPDVLAAPWWRVV
ncbi:MAG TPA: ATP-binding protein [Trueperaceae bacterium]|nr:ATP-binding protein [Trueperaceae bacterium]